jgi:hypothetical protein
MKIGHVVLLKLILDAENEKDELYQYSRYFRHEEFGERKQIVEMCL